MCCCMKTYFFSFLHLLTIPVDLCIISLLCTLDVFEWITGIIGLVYDVGHWDYCTVLIHSWPIWTSYALFLHFQIPRCPSLISSLISGPSLLVITILLHLHTITSLTENSALQLQSSWTSASSLADGKSLNTVFIRYLKTHNSTIQ